MLVDLLATLALGMSVLCLVVNLLVLMENSSSQQSVDADLQYSARVVRNVILSEVRNARSLSVIGNGDELLVTNPEGKVIRYYCRNGNFYRYYKTSNPIAENVQRVNFLESDSCLLVELFLQSEQANLQLNFVCAARC